MTTKQSHSDQAIELANKRAKARAYYQAHKSDARAYYKANSAKIRERAMIWRVANRERYLEQQRMYDIVCRGYRSGKRLAKLRKERDRNRLSTPKV